METPSEELTNELRSFLSRTATLSQSEAERVTGILSELRTRCEHRAVDAQLLNSIETCLTLDQKSSEVQFAVGSTIAFCFLELGLPDRADNLLHALERSVANDIAKYGHDDFVKWWAWMNAQLAEQLGQEERADRNRKLAMALGDPDIVTGMLAGAYDNDITRMQRERIQRREHLESLIRDLDGGEPRAIAALQSELESQQDLSDLCVEGWLKLSVHFLARDDVDAAFDAIERATTHVRGIELRLPNLAGFVITQRVRVNIARDDIDAATKGLRQAVDLLSNYRSSAANPRVRMGLSNWMEWTDDLIVLARTLRRDTLLLLTLEALAMHGLAEVVTSGGHHSIETQTDSASAIERLFAAVWRPQHFSSAYVPVPSQTAALYVRLVGRDDHPQIVGVLSQAGKAHAWHHSVSFKFAQRLATWDLKAATLNRSRTLRAMSDTLLPPIWIANRQVVPNRVVIVPSDGTARLPYGSLLLDESARLGDVADVIMMPSMTLLNALPRDVTVQRGTALVVGVDAEDDRSTGLGVKGLKQEMESLVAAGFVVKQVRSFGELQDKAPTADMCVFAVHGTTRGGRNILHFPDGSLVSTDQLIAVRLPQVVVASSCWSGALASDPSPLSLVPVAVAAGARAMVVALWDVRSTETSAVLSRFYEGIGAGQPIGPALAEAQRSLYTSYNPVQLHALAAVAA